MSYESCHMENKVVLCRFQAREITMEELMKMEDEDFFGWNSQHYGNTKFEDLPIVVAFFRCWFHQGNAAKLVGYVAEDEDGKPVGAIAISLRLQRINTKDPMELIRACIRAGHIKRRDLTYSLQKPLYRKGRLSRAAIWWGNRICKSSLKKYGSHTKAADSLGITKEELNIWLNC